MNISSVISLLGGVALFLFGMGLMGDGLKQCAGNKMELILFKLSNTPLKGVLLGTAVTAVIQSSAATSVMVVGFVNSAMMTLKQAIGVILGSIFGTSITGWIIALSELGSSNSGIMSLLSTSTLTGLIAVTGIIIKMTAKKSQSKHISNILIGFAILMYGISSMSSAVAPLKSSPDFISLMTKFTNPVLGLFTGIVITAILQSASSAVGLLQTLAFTGVIDFSMAFPILLGMNIGASVPVLMSSVGAKADARRSAFSYLALSTFGSAAVGIIFYALDKFIGFGFKNTILDAFDIALVNSVFRFASVIVIFPQIGLIDKILRHIISDDEVEEDTIVPPLEERFLSNPAVALEQCRQAVEMMTKVVGRNINNAISLLNFFDEEEYKKVEMREDATDKFEDKLGSYLVKIASNEINHKQSKQASEYLHAIGDLERISDHALNIAECAKEIYDKKIVFSESGKEELAILSSALSEVMGLAFDSFIHNYIDEAYMVEPLEETIDELCDIVKANHIERLKRGICTIEHGYVFNDLLTNAERVSDHCSNMALAVIDVCSENFDAHEYINELEKIRDDTYIMYYESYMKKYAIKEYTDDD